MIWKEEGRKPSQSKRAAQGAMRPSARARRRRPDLLDWQLRKCFAEDVVVIVVVDDHINITAYHSSSMTHAAGRLQRASCALAGEMKL